MTLMWLVALPLAMAIVVLVLHQIRVLAAPLTAATLVAMAVLSVSWSETRPLVLLGRSIGLAPGEAAGLALCCLLLAVLVLYGYRIPQGPMACPLALAAMGLLTAATLVNNTTIAGALLEIGVVVAVLLVPSRRPGAAMAGMRVLTLVSLSAPMLLLASWAGEYLMASPGDLLVARIGGLAVVIGFGLSLGVVPFHVWLPPVFRHASPLAIAMLSVVANLAMLFYLGSMLQVTMWPGQQAFYAAILLAGGILTGIMAGIMAFPQRSVHRALAYAALADMGLVFVGLGVGTAVSVRAATLHVALRAVGVVAVSMAAGVLQTSLGGDDVEHLRGGLRRAPLSLAAMALGGASLAGLPLTAGFATRFVLYRAMAAENAPWAVLVVLASAGPAWAFVRCLLAAIVSAPTTGEHREPLMPSLLSLALSLSLLFLGIFPHALSWLPENWLAPLWPIASIR
jgi:formate hydrogenlyase subunit 3/multisubunit Na+/H+ antiporter MnhD subunit